MPLARPLRVAAVGLVLAVTGAVALPAATGSAAVIVSDTTPTPDPTSTTVTPTPDPTSTTVTPTPDPTSTTVTPTPDPTSTTVTPTPDPTSTTVTPTPDPTSTPTPDPTTSQPTPTTTITVTPTPTTTTTPPKPPAPRPITYTTAVSVKTSHKRIYVQRRLTISGKVTPARAGRLVYVQRYWSGRWYNNAVSRTTASGSYSVKVPTGDRNTYRLRVYVPQTKVGVSTYRSRVTGSFKVAVVAKPVPTSKSFSLLYPEDNGTWARWNPCAPVNYRVNPGPLRRSTAIAETKAAAARLSKATGIRFVYKGTTTAIPGRSRSKYPKGTHLVVAWAKPGQSSWMPRSYGRNVAGMGGAITIDNAYNTAGYVAPQITSAGVVLNASLPLAGGFGWGPRYGYQGTRGQLIMHEMAHASGLGHTESWSQIMYGTMGRKPATFGKGDLAGLRLVGKSQGCLTSKPKKR